MGDEMAFIALRHPRDDVRQLIEHALGRLGHITLDPADEERADVVVLEPASPDELAAAQRLRTIVCVSIAPPFAEALALGPAAYLVKPFTVAGLRSTVESVLAADLRELHAV